MLAGSRAIGIGAHDKEGKMVPFAFTRRQPGPTDVAIQVAYCGICHSDYHTVLNEWGGTAYPVVPGCDAKTSCQGATPRCTCHPRSAVLRWCPLSMLAILLSPSSKAWSTGAHAPCEMLSWRVQSGIRVSVQSDRRKHGASSIHGEVQFHVLT